MATCRAPANLLPNVPYLHGRTFLRGRGSQKSKSGFPGLVSASRRSGEPGATNHEGPRFSCP